MILRGLRTLIPTLIILAIGSSAYLVAQNAIIAVTRTSNFPPIGLASSETAQLNVVNLASGNGASCSGTIGFFNTSGTMVGSTTPFTVSSGQIASATLSFSSLGVSGVRGEFRGVVTLTEGAGVPCNLAFSEETYDTTTGVTHVVLTAAESAQGPIVVPLTRTAPTPR